MLDLELSLELFHIGRDSPRTTGQPDCLCIEVKQTKGSRDRLKQCRCTRIYSLSIRPYRHLLEFAEPPEIRNRKNLKEYPKTRSPNSFFVDSILHKGFIDVRHPDRVEMLFCWLCFYMRILNRGGGTIMHICPFPKKNMQQHRQLLTSSCLGGLDFCPQRG